MEAERRRPINISGFNRAPVTTHTPVPGRAPTRAGTLANRSAARDFAAGTRISHSSQAGRSNGRKKCSVVITLAASLTASGFDRSVAACRPWSPGIFPGPSSATTPALLPGTLRCNNAGAPAGDGNAPRTLSADSTASAADGAIASADPLDFRDDL